MPLFIGALLGALIQIAGTLVGKVLLSLGIGYVTYSGVDTSIGWVKAFALSHISATSSQTVAAASTMQVGTCISILTSALVARMVMNGLTSGALKKMVVK
jgi:hypothetical protein